MFDSTYFQAALPAQIAGAGEDPTVELFLVSGQTHRVRAVEEIAKGYVVLEVYQRRAEGIGAAMPWRGTTAPAAGADDTHRAAISYDAISQVIITRPAGAAAPRIGFGSR